MEKISENIDKLYTEIKPILLSYARRYKAPNPNDIVNDWMSTAYIIARRFDDGELTKRIESDKKFIEYDPTKHTTDMFAASLKKYLITAFIHDIIKQYNVGKKYIAPAKDAPATEIFDVESNKQGRRFTMHDADSANLSDLKDIVDSDIRKLQANCTTILDLTNVKFLESVSAYCAQLLEKFGDFQVVQDLDIGENRHFFSEDFKEDAETGIRKELCKIILKEENPAIIQKLGVLINPNNKGTLQKRIFRYFFESRGGIPARLKRKIV